MPFGHYSCTLAGYIPERPSQNSVSAKSADIPARIVGRKLRLRKLKALRAARGYQSAEHDRRLFCGFGLASRRKQQLNLAPLRLCLTGMSLAREHEDPHLQVLAGMR